MFNIVMLISGAIAVLGILLAYALHLRDRARTHHSQTHVGHRPLFPGAVSK